MCLVKSTPASSDVKHTHPLSKKSVTLAEARLLCAQMYRTVLPPISEHIRSKERRSPDEVHTLRPTQ